MRKLLFILALLCAPMARAQTTYPVSYSNGGNITATNAACIPTACVGITLPGPTAAVITVGVTGTFSATLAVEESQDGGFTFTSAGTSLTSTGTTSYVIAGFTTFRVRASAYSSGNAGVNLQVSNAPSGDVTSGTTDPTGTACAANALYVRSTNGFLYTCDAGVFALLSGGSSGTVTNIATTGPITGGPITTTGTIACPTCTTSAAAITNNVLAKGSGGAQGLANSSVTDNGTTVAATEPISSTGAFTSGANGGTAGQIVLNGSSSSASTLTVNATGATITAGGAFAAAASLAAATAYNLNGRLMVSATGPTIATGGCGGSGASVTHSNGTAAFEINVGTGPTSAGCTFTMPGAPISWVCNANDQTTQSATVFVQKQTGADSTTSVTIQTFAATGSANAPTASDIYHLACSPT